MQSFDGQTLKTNWLWNHNYCNQIQWWN